MGKMVAELTRLSEALPPPRALAESEDGEEQLRAALAVLVERALRGVSDFAFAQVPEDPATCPNCGVDVTSTRTPYCSEHCRETSAFIRQIRNTIKSGAIFDPVRQAAFGQSLWRIQGGGYPVRQRMVTEKSRAKIIARDGGVCSVCGAPATEVEHIGSG
jgi:hypothetical protein